MSDAKEDHAELVEEAFQHQLIHSDVIEYLIDNYHIIISPKRRFYLVHGPGRGGKNLYSSDNHYLIIEGMFTRSITCEDVKKKGSGSAFTIDELQSLSNLNREGVEECIIFLGKEPLSSEQSATIWSALIRIYRSAYDIPEESLQHLGWIVNGISSEQFYNISLTEVDTVAAFGKCSSLSSDQLESLNYAVFQQWSSKDIEDLSSYDLITLRQILCAFNESDILRIHPDAYKEAAHELATLSNCSKEVLEGLAQLATSSLAFGNPKNWTSLHVATIGCIVAGLPSIKLIPPLAMEGFTKNIVACLPTYILQEMTEEQISNLSPSAAGSLSPKQLSALYQSQKYALQTAVKGTPENERSFAIILFEKKFMLLKTFSFVCIISLF